MMALLATAKADAITDAYKLQAIEQSIIKDELPYVLTEQRNLEVEDTQSRTKVWVDTHNDSKRKLNLPDPNVNTPYPRPDIPENAAELPPATNRSADRVQAANVKEDTNDSGLKRVFAPKGFASNPPIFTPTSTIPGPTVLQECIEGIAKTNERVVVSLAKQNLPKCHPEVFEGDATLFHPWKNRLRL